MTRVKGATTRRRRWLFSRRKAMLDYSDEEAEVVQVRRRNPAPSTSGSLVSIFKFPRAVAPRAWAPANEAFMVNELVAVKAGIPEEPQFFGAHSQGEKKILSGATKDGLFAEHQGHPDSFYKSMKLLVFWAQFFGVFPVSGTAGPSYKSLRFKWLHYKTFYWALVLVGSLFGVVCSVIYGLSSEDFAQVAAGIGFFSCGSYSSLLMLNLARNWKKVNEEFVRAELKLKKYGYPKGIRFKLYSFTVLVLLLALAEHLLLKAKNLRLVVECARRKDNFLDLAESFFVHEYVEVFHIYNYNLWKAILVLVLHFLVTVNWSVKDLFLCLVSWSIAERFTQVRRFLEQVHGEERPVSFWKEVREDYNNIFVLTKKIDTHLQKLMLLSIGSNLFFICIQLLNTLKKKHVSQGLFYFFWSFGFLVFRTSLVAFSAARINDESKEPKTVLYSVPQRSYSGEVRRFLTQLTTNDVALTGGGFFSVTRSLILTITGTVITYEIVLVQFSSDGGGNEEQTNRTTCLN